jgi:hypothetical protein
VDIDGADVLGHLDVGDLDRSKIELKQLLKRPF